MPTPDSASSHSREIILVVDDSPATLGFLTDSLETIGVTVLVSPSGDHALKLVNTVTPDIVLMDAMMPGMDGFETCRQLKCRQEFQHVPVIFMTGLSATEHIVKALEVGGVDYLTKPVSTDELLARMQVHLANARATRSAQVALDKSRRYLFAADPSGHVIWRTPEAGRLLALRIGGLSSSSEHLDPGAVNWLKTRISSDAVNEEMDYRVKLENDCRLIMNYLGEASPNEHIVRIVEHDIGKDSALLAERYALTTREAEVAAWVSQGKSNKEIAEILSLSPRTVNKHLERVFEKIGVDNRTSAATAIVKVLAAPKFS
jgi:DNA-binding NarL/FixJ family response regulator